MQKWKVNDSHYQMKGCLASDPQDPVNENVKNVLMWASNQRLEARCNRVLWLF